MTDLKIVKSEQLTSILNKDRYIITSGWTNQRIAIAETTNYQKSYGDGFGSTWYKLSVTDNTVAEVLALISTGEIEMLIKENIPQEAKYISMINFVLESVEKNVSFPYIAGMTKDDYTKIVLETHRNKVQAEKANRAAIKTVKAEIAARTSGTHI